MKLTQDQSNALGRISDWLSSGDRHPSVLKGYAGTGKTTIMRTLINSFAGDLLLSAPTNKAADVLATATGMPTTTVHSALKLRLQSDAQKKYIARGRGKLALPRHNGLWVIDEASMIDSTLLKEIRAASCRVLFVGDPMQLPPVNETASPALCFEGPELTHIMRQKAGSSVIALGGYCRALLNGQNPPLPTLESPVHKVPSETLRAEFLRAAAEHENVRMLCWTNAAVHNWSQAARQAAGYPPDRPAKGERLYAAAPYGDDIKTDTEVEVFSVDEEADEFGGTWQVECDMQEYGSTVVPIAKRPDLVAAEVARLKAIALKISPGQRSSAWKAMHKFADSYGDLRSTYAMTVHRSQGSTFPSVFVDLPDITRCKDLALRRRLVYVAITRTSGDLWIAL